MCWKENHWKHRREPTIWQHPVCLRQNFCKKQQLFCPAPNGVWATITHNVSRRHSRLHHPRQSCQQDGHLVRIRAAPHYCNSPGFRLLLNTNYPFLLAGTASEANFSAGSCHVDATVGTSLRASAWFAALPCRQPLPFRASGRACGSVGHFHGSLLQVHFEGYRWPQRAGGLAGLRRCGQSHSLSALLCLDGHALGPLPSSRKLKAEIGSNSKNLTLPFCSLRFGPPLSVLSWGLLFKLSQHLMESARIRCLTKKSSKL